MNNQKKSQKTWRSLKLMGKKKTRSHSSQHRGKEGCESQLESDKARNPGANRNPRTDRKYWRLKGTGNLLETKLFFLLYPMEFYSRLNSTLNLREGRREVKIHNSLSPTCTPWARATSQGKTQRRKDNNSPGWLQLVDNGSPIQQSAYQGRVKGT